MSSRNPLVRVAAITATLLLFMLLAASGAAADAKPAAEHQKPDVLFLLEVFLTA